MRYDAAVNLGTRGMFKHTRGIFAFEKTTTTAILLQFLLELLTATVLAGII
jgi:hypothetical protein